MADMFVPLVLELWDNPLFKGDERSFVQDEEDLTHYAFGGRATSAKVHAGPDYTPNASVTLWAHKFPIPAGTRSLTLNIGAYQDLREVKFSDATQSVAFHGGSGDPVKDG